MTFRSHSPARIGLGASLPGFSKKVTPDPKIQRAAFGSCPLKARLTACPMARKTDLQRISGGH